MAVAPGRRRLRGHLPRRSGLRDRRRGQRHGSPSTRPRPTSGPSPSTRGPPARGHRGRGPRLPGDGRRHLRDPARLRRDPRAVARRRRGRSRSSPAARRGGSSTASGPGRGLRAPRLPVPGDQGARGGRDGAVYAAAVNGGAETPPAPAARRTGWRRRPGPVAQVTVTETFTVVAPSVRGTGNGVRPQAGGGPARCPRGAVLRIDAGRQRRDALELHRGRAARAGASGPGGSSSAPATRGSCTGSSGTAAGPSSPPSPRSR